MDLRQFEYFVAVARRRHFGRAAEDLYVTQSAVSQQVRRLETELGLALFTRTAKGVELTPAGSALLAHAEAILADVAGARAAMDEHAGALRGAVRVAVATGDGMRLAPALARFHDDHPGIRVTLRQGGLDQVLALLRESSVEIALACLREPSLPSGLAAEPLGAEPLVLAVAAGDPLAGARDVELADLRERPFILAEPGTALRGLVLDAFAEVGFTPVPLFEASDPALACSLVAAGLGVAIVPASWAAHPGVSTANLASPAPRHELSLLWRAGALSPAAALLDEHLRASLKSG